MSEANETSKYCIKDAENLLKHFYALHPGSGHSPPAIDGFNRAGFLRCLMKPMPRLQVKQ
jgi:hypothetical protein